MQQIRLHQRTVCACVCLGSSVLTFKLVFDFNMVYALSACVWQSTKTNWKFSQN